MKTLKFMLAAATAIGLASAYAEPEAGASTTFESFDSDTDVVSGLQEPGAELGQTYFYFEGLEGDNESKILSSEGAVWPAIDRPRGATGARNKILQVSTGAEPLLRAFESFSSSGEPRAAEYTTDVYVDTLVQFTVTPCTDNVEPTVGTDKLMIYLKEFATTENDETTYRTNLVVVGGYCPAVGTFVATNYEAQLASPVNPGQWYRLTVRAIPNVGKVQGSSTPAFMVFLDNQVLTFDQSCCATPVVALMALSDDYQSYATARQMVFSILGSNSGEATIKAVGFAGEGKVDDLMITSGLDPFATVYDFTFAYDTDKISAISYTVGSQDYDQAVSGIQVEENTQVVINSITFAGNYELDNISVVGLREDGENTYTVTNNATLTIVAQEKQSAPLEPGQQDPTTYNSQEAAAAAAAKVVVGVPSAVASELSPAQQEAYATLFEAKVVDNGDGTYNVVVGLTEEAEDDLQDQVDDDAAAVIADLSADDVTLTTTPGLYYSFEYGTTLENMTEGDRTLATGATLTLDRPTTENATAGFYKVMVNVTDKE